MFQTDEGNFNGETLQQFFLVIQGDCCMGSAYCRKDLHSLLGAHRRETGPYRYITICTKFEEKNFCGEVG